MRSFEDLHRCLSVLLFVAAIRDETERIKRGVTQRIRSVSANLSMSTIHPDRPSIRTGSSDKIRRGVEERHWQLFEVRLKKPPLEQNRNPYTKSNDYRVIDRLNPTDHPQTPLEPRRRWQTFSSQLTDQSNETDRLTSLFRNVWLTNWRTKQTPSTPRPNSKSSGDAFLQRLSNNEKDRRVISSILHRHI